MPRPTAPRTTKPRRAAASRRTPATPTRAKPALHGAAAPAFLAKLNADVSRRARVEHVGSLTFGTRTIEQFRLGNGLRVLVLEDDRAPLISYHTWFRVGSRHEVEGKTGLAHLFEHLMFNETESLPAGAFDRKLEAAGAQTNAATWNDWTYYHADIPAAQLGLVVRLEAERMRNLVLREPQVKSEIEVVANERRYRVDDDVDGQIGEILYKTAFDRHPYHHPTIGWMNDILGFTTHDCRKFYKTYYAPNNATVVIVGDITPARALRVVQRAYGEIPSSRIPDEARTEEPEQTAERTVAIALPTPVAKLAIGYRGPALGDADHAPLSVLSEALFGGRSARMFRELVTRRELASDAQGSVSTFHDPGLWELYLNAREGVSAAALLAAMDAVLADLRAHPITQDERDRAVARMELGYLQGLETVGGRAEQIGFFDTVLDDPRGGLTRVEKVLAVDVAQIAQVSAKYLDARRRTVIAVSPAPNATEAAS